MSPRFLARLPFLSGLRVACVAVLALATGLPVLGGCSGPTQRPPGNFNASPRGRAIPLPAPDLDDRTDVRRVLRRQARAWNEGDLETYMAGYARTDTLRFASGRTVRTGWEETLARYRRGYPSDEAMGTLSFSEMDVDLLSGRHALVFGRWDLARAPEAGGDAGGLFTLLLENVRTDEGRRWRIVHDHTSAGN
jgi:ketosteroid isomerase-like protein